MQFQSSVNGICTPCCQLCIFALKSGGLCTLTIGPVNHYAVHALLIIIVPGRYEVIFCQYDQ